jgi:ABC-type sugar transport system ATPase subunit
MTAHTSTAGLALRAENVSKSYGKRVVLDIDHVELAPGETLALLGPSGAGKSTLLAILGLLEKPDSGQVFLDGRPVSARDRRCAHADGRRVPEPVPLQGHHR